jgi:hypothetical protein
MSANEPLTEEEVKELILTFWKMQEEKAHLVDLMEVTAPDLEISMGEFAWHGYRGPRRPLNEQPRLSSSTSTSTPEASPWASQERRQP